MVEWSGVPMFRLYSGLAFQGWKEPNKAPEQHHKALCGYLPMCSLRVRRKGRVQNRPKELCRSNAASYATSATVVLNSDGERDQSIH